MLGILSKKSGQNGTEPSLVTGVFSITLSTIVVKTLGLFYKIPISSILGDEGMGYFNSAYTVYTFFFILCTAGVPKAVMILISEAKARGNKIEEGQIIYVASLVFLSLGVLFTFLLCVFARPLSTLIGNSNSYATIIAVAPSMIFVSLAGVIRGYLSANLKFLDIGVSGIVEGVGKLVLGLVFANLGSRLHLPLEIISALTILGATLGSAFSLVYLLVGCKIKITNEKMGQKRKIFALRSIIKRIFAISIPITMSTAVMSMTSLIDLGLIMRCIRKIGLSENSASALYGNYTTLAVPMLNLALALITPISVTFLPKLTDCAVNKNIKEHTNAEKELLSLTSFISAPMVIGFMIFPREILELLFKNSEIGIGAALLFTLAPSIAFASLLTNINTILEANGKLSAPFISVSIGSAFKLIVSWITISYTDLGILGAPIGTVVSYAISLLVSLIIYRNTLRKNLPIIGSIYKNYFLAFVSVGISRIIYDLFEKNSVSLFFSIGIGALIFLAFSVMSGNIMILKRRKIAK